MEVLLRHWQYMVRGLHILDHVLRRQEFMEKGLQPDGKESPGNHVVPVPAKSLTGFESLRKVILIVLICGPIYGAAMGSYALVNGQRSLLEQIPQMIFSGIKVPLLIGVTVVISLPSFYVINTLLGLRDDFRELIRAIVSAQAGLTVILMSLFPLTIFIYVSMAENPASYSIAVLINSMMFGLASISAQVLLRGYYRPLISKNGRHRWMVRMWIFVFAFVGIQAGYVLRPFIGNPKTPTSFFRHESFENAYVKILGLVGDVISKMLGGSS